MKESLLRKKILIKHFLNRIRVDHQHFRLKTQGDSMLPLIPEGSELIIEGCKVNELKRGDLVVFYDKNNLSVHRCIWCWNKSFYERGDNCGLWVSLIQKKEESLLGKVIEIHYSNNKSINLESDKYKRYTKFLVKIGIFSGFIGCFLRRKPFEIKHSGIQSKKIFQRLIWKQINSAYELYILSSLS